MKVFITGVAGFIGSNLAKKLIVEGHKVIGIDNLSYGQLSNIASLKENSSFSLIIGDICNPYLYKKVEADVIVHLASQKIPRYSSALRTLDENRIMLSNIIEKCLKDGSRLVFSSTSDVYGKNPKVPFSEESDLVMGPTKVRRWAYAVSKMHSEQLLIATGEECGLKYSIARFFGSYGPNQNLTWWGGPQSVFIGKALMKEPIEIHGDGMQTRTFTYVEDTIEGLKHLLFDDKALGEIFNTGSFPQDEITISDLAKLIWKLVNGEDSQPLLNYVPYSTFGRYEDVMRRVPNISKLQNYFGFEPQYSLSRGLEETIAWQRKVTSIKVI